MKTSKIIIVENKLGKFAFTRDEKNNLISQELDENDWDMVDMFGLDNQYKGMVEKAIEQLN
tara:strand:- start:1068 stop:1250 length:183 start_codon:yes stop_codon:yes gene_type:complete